MVIRTEAIRCFLDDSISSSSQSSNWVDNFDQHSRRHPVVKLPSRDLKRHHNGDVKKLKAPFLFQTYALLTAPYHLQKQLRCKTFDASGLSPNPFATPAKNFQNLLRGGSLSTKGDIVLLHDLINNTPSRRSNGNRGCSIEELLHILAEYKHKIGAIVYTKRGGPPNVVNDFFESTFLVIDVEKYQLSPESEKTFFFENS